MASSIHTERALLDCGTGYTKILSLDTGEYRIAPSRETMRMMDRFEVVGATGHNTGAASGRRENELVCLAEGGLALVDEPDFIILDCGARDVKYARVEGRRVVGMDWNSECGAFSGQVIELLMKYFDISPDSTTTAGGRIPVVCGVLGMTRMFDMISQGTPHNEAFAAFLRGIAGNCETMLGGPKKIYLSGGLCDNAAFLGSFSCDAEPLGRFVLLEGLKRILDIKP